MNTELLEKYEIDYEKGLSRCMGDEDFYLQILNLFLKDSSFLRSQNALEHRNYAELFDTLHELKGICGNAALTGLYNAIVPLVDLLRYEKGTPEEITELYQKIEVFYKRTKEGVLLLIEQEF